MKKHKSFLALFWAASLCICFLTACKDSSKAEKDIYLSDDTKPSSDTQTEKEADSTETSLEVKLKSEAVFAKVSSVNADGSLSLMLYSMEDADSEPENTDYNDVDWNNYAYAFDTMEYIVSDNSIIRFAGTYSFEESYTTEIRTGNMLVIYQDESGKDVIVVYKNTDITG